MAAEDQGLNGCWLLFLSDFNGKTEKNFQSGRKYQRDHRQDKRQDKTMADLSCAGNSASVRGRLSKKSARSIFQLSIFPIQYFLQGSYRLFVFFPSEALVGLQKIPFISRRISIKD